MVHHPADEPRRDPIVDQDGSTLRPLDAPAAATTDAEADRDERLGEAIEAFLERAEGGLPPDPAEFAADYPDLGDDLVAALEGLALVKGLVGGPGGPGHRLEEGRRVAGYRIVREIGRGGMGVVYEAVHVGLDRPVALKVLGSQATPDSSGRRRFLNEARTAAGLHHTHIVPVFDVGQVGGLCYYAMQRIEGSGLDRVLKALRRDRTVASGSTGSTLRPGKSRPGGSAPRLPDDPRAILSPLPVLGDETLSWAGGGSKRPGRWLGDAEAERDEAPAFAPPRGSGYYRWVAGVGMQAAEALAHAHQRGIIHRDIKPSNLLVDARGTIWVADFGLARRLADPSQTQVDSLLGTPRYMSPEQARTGAIDGRADVYSLGATLYELITLRPPFDGQSAAELIDQITGREPLRPRRFDARVPLDLETILLKALAKRPADRYAGAAELAEDLGRFLAHEPVRARRIGPVGRAWRFARRHPGASTVSALAAAVVLTTATIAYVHIDRARDAALRAQGDTEKANAQLQTRNQELRAAMLGNLEKQAANTRLTVATNRRAEGLDLIRQAVQMAGRVADPGLPVRLRDQATAFLTARDVKAGPALALPGRLRREVAFGPTGRRVATLDGSGDLVAWDLDRPTAEAGGAVRAAPQRWISGGGGGGGPAGRGPHNPHVSQWDRIVQVGDQVATICPTRDGVLFFDLASPDKPIGRRMPIPDQWVGSIVAADDGQHFLTLGELNRPAPPDRTEKRNDHPRTREDEGTVVTACLWDRQQLQAPVATIALPPRRVDEMPARPLVALAPDGSRVALAYADDGKVSLWDGAGQPMKDGAGTPLEPIRVEGAMRALALGPSGLLAVADNGGGVALWDLNPSHPKQLPPLDLHQGFVSLLLRFNPRDGSTLAIASNAGVELWDLATRSPIVALPASEFVSDLAFAPDGQALAAADASGVTLWSLIEPTALVALPESADEPMSLAFGPDGTLAIASHDGNFEPAPLQLWGWPARCSGVIVDQPDRRPTAVSFDGRGQLICLEQDAVRWFHSPGAQQSASFSFPNDPRPEHRRTDRRGEGPGPGPLNAALSRLYSSLIPIRAPDGRAILFLQRDRNPRGSRLSLWQQAEPQSLKSLDVEKWIGDLGWILPVLSPGADRLYYMIRQPETLVCRSATGDGFGRAEWSVPLAGAVSLALKPDGSTLAVGLASGAVEMRDAATGQPLRDAAAGDPRAILPVPNKDDAGPAQALAFSPDGRTLAVGGRKQVRLWSVADRPEPLVRLPGYHAGVRLLAFDRRGERLAAADDESIKVWNLGQLRAELGRLGLAWGPTGSKNF